MIASRGAGPGLALQSWEAASIIRLDPRYEVPIHPVCRSPTANLHLEAVARLSSHDSSDRRGRLSMRRSSSSPLFYDYVKRL